MQAHELAVELAKVTPYSEVLITGPDGRHKVGRVTLDTDNEGRDITLLWQED